MAKVTISESKLREMIAESVREVLKEGFTSADRKNFMGNKQRNKADAMAQRMYNDYVKRAGDNPQYGDFNSYYQALQTGEYKPEYNAPNGGYYTPQTPEYNAYTEWQKFNSRANRNGITGQGQDMQIKQNQETITGLQGQIAQLNQQIQTLTANNQQLTKTNKTYLSNINKLKQQLAAVQNVQSKPAAGTAAPGTPAATAPAAGVNERKMHSRY